MLGYIIMKYLINSKSDFTKIILSIVIILALIEIVPYLITILFPNLCYGCTSIGKFQQYLNKSINLGYISWFSYTLLFLYFIYRNEKETLLRIAKRK